MYWQKLKHIVTFTYQPRVQILLLCLIQFATHNLILNSNHLQIELKQVLHTSPFTQIKLQLLKLCIWIITELKYRTPITRYFRNNFANVKFLFFVVKRPSSYYSGVSKLHFDISKFFKKGLQHHQVSIVCNLTYFVIYPHFITFFLF